MAHSLTGTRIREYRLRVGISQTVLARNAGISPSYLNLIEHNKRGIAGKVLIAIARELNTSAATLTESLDSGLSGALQGAASLATTPSAEVDTLSEFAGKFPGWSSLLAALYRQTQDQTHTIEALSDRLTHDPFLGESLHLMLSNITAIRSTSEILTSVANLTTEQRTRFHNAIHDESKRLSDVTQSLIGYFDKTAQDTPEEPSETSKSDVQAMPLDHFAASAHALDYNPSALAAEFRTSLHAIFRRLSSLKSAGVEAPEMGVIIINAAGHPLHRAALSDFPLPRHGAACPLWPLFRGFAQPGHPLQDVIELPNGKQFTALTVALPHSETPFGTPPVYQSAMMFAPREHSPWPMVQQAVRYVGTSCQICPRKNCAARSENSVL